MKSNLAISEVSCGGLLWVDVTRQAEKELREVQKRFKFVEQDILESLPPFQRAKIVKRPDYYFMVLHFPFFDRATGRIGYTEIDFFFGANFLVTVHGGRLAVLEKFFDECRKKEPSRHEFFQGTAARVLLELLTRLLDSIFPILLHVNEDINLVDKKLFGRAPGREMAEEILRLKTNVVAFRRTMQGHRVVLERLIMHSGRELDLGSHRDYLSGLREYTGEIWNTLESQKESINALHETNESISSLRINEIMKTLTVISVVTFPLSLFASILAIEARGRPFVNWPYGFWIICFLMLAGAGLMLWFFKRQKWM